MHACEPGPVRPVNYVYCAFGRTWLSCRCVVILTEADVANLEYAEEDCVLRGQFVDIQRPGIPDVRGD